MVRRADLPQLISILKSAKEFQNVQLNKGYRSSEFQIAWKKGTVFHVEFLHKVSNHSLIFADEEQLLAGRIQSKGGVALPNIENLFDLVVLDCFLNHRGLNDVEYRFFKDFHILVKEGLLEHFNQTYGTSFRLLHELTDYNESYRTTVIQYLKTMPANQFINHIQVQWTNLLGVFRQARIF